MFDSREEKQLTKRQRQVLEFVREHAERHGYPPTVREIATAVGVSSSSTVHAQLKSLERQGLIERTALKRRALRASADPEKRTKVATPSAEEEIYSENARVLPLVGDVAAGAPLLAEQNIEAHVAVPALLVRPGESFVLKIRGDSMIDAGIHDRDYAVVRRQQAAQSGEIVVALVQDEATCKRLRFERGRPVLEPANEAFQTLRPDDFSILGVVTGVMRAL